MKKRDGGELSRAEIQFLIEAIVRSGATRGCDPDGEIAASVSEAQIGAFLMAVFQRGLSAAELADLTEAMKTSGELFSFAGLRAERGAFTVDKHSTGGVGDKTSLLVAPIVAALGGDPRSVLVPMISGRSLGHTGGTLDKLETIPGFDTQIGPARAGEILRLCGAVMMGQTPALVPADRILYALRDHTGTVESPHLITASIMSKKLAEDLDGLVLDVKFGSGAFTPSYSAAKELAELMVSTGVRAGTRTVALLTQMHQPLGRFAGNWVEVWECVDILKGLRHPLSEDLIELSCVLAGWMLHLAGVAASAEQGAAMADAVLQDGRAYSAWLRMVEAQGGDVSVFRNPAIFHKPLGRMSLNAKVSGFLADMDCREVGWAVQRLGAGRVRPGDTVRAHAGMEVHAKIGDWLERGQPLFTLFGDSELMLTESAVTIEDALRFSDDPVVRAPLVREVVQAG